MQLFRALSLLLAAAFIGLWVFVFWALRPFPQGRGSSSLSPDGRMTAVLLPIEDAGLGDALRYLLHPKVKKLPTHQRLDLHVIDGDWESGRDLFHRSLPFQNCPMQPLNPAEIFRWSETSATLHVTLRGTNLVVQLPIPDAS